MTWASWGPLGSALGGLLGRLGGLLGRLEAVLGVLGRSFDDSGPKKSRGETSRSPGEPRQTQEDLRIWGPGP